MPLPTDYHDDPTRLTRCTYCMQLVYVAVHRQWPDDVRISQHRALRYSEPCVGSNCPALIVRATWW